MADICTCSKSILSRFFVLLICFVCLNCQLDPDAACSQEDDEWNATICEIVDQENIWRFAYEFPNTYLRAYDIDECKKVVRENPKKQFYDFFKFTIDLGCHTPFYDEQIITHKTSDFYYLKFTFLDLKEKYDLFVKAESSGTIQQKTEAAFSLKTAHNLISVQSWEWQIGHLDKLTVVLDESIEISDICTKLQDSGIVSSGELEQFTGDEVAVACPCGYVLGYTYHTWDCKNEVLDVCKGFDLRVDTKFPTCFDQNIKISTCFLEDYTSLTSATLEKYYRLFILTLLESCPEVDEYPRGDSICPIGWAVDTQNSEYTCKKCIQSTGSPRNSDTVGTYRQDLYTAVNPPYVLFFNQPEQTQCLPCPVCTENEFRTEPCGPYRTKEECQDCTQIPDNFYNAEDFIKLIEQGNHYKTLQRDYDITIGDAYANAEGARTLDAWLYCSWEGFLYNYTRCTNPDSSLVFIPYCLFTAGKRNNEIVKPRDVFNGNRPDLEPEEKCDNVTKKESLALTLSGKFECVSCFEVADYVNSKNENCPGTDCDDARGILNGQVSSRFFGRYISKCDAMFVDTRKCDWIFSDDYTEFGTYQPAALNYTECVNLVIRGEVGLGDEEFCNILKNERNGKYLQQCNNGGLIWENCATEENLVRCGQTSILAYCGVHWSTDDVAWELNNINAEIAGPCTTLAPDYNTCIFERGSVMHPGTCVSCEEIACVRCGEDCQDGNFFENVLSGCGQVDINGNTVIQLASNDLLLGNGASVLGKCVSCGFSNEALCISNENIVSNFWHAECEDPNVAPESLSCFLCDGSNCSVYQYLSNCGGTSKGQCTNCTADDINRNSLDNIVFFPNSPDLMYPNCLFRCANFYIGWDCSTKQSNVTCEIGYPGPRVPPYQQICNQCQNVIPETSILNNYSDPLFNLFLYGNFDYFFPTDKNDFSEEDFSTIEVLNNDNQLNYVGYSMIEPSISLYSDNNIIIRRCINSQFSGEFDHSLHSYYCGRSFLDIYVNVSSTIQMGLSAFSRQNYFVFSLWISHFDNSTLPITLSISLIKTRNDGIKVQKLFETRNVLFTGDLIPTNVRMFLSTKNKFSCSLQQCVLKIQFSSNQPCNIAFDDIHFQSARFLLTGDRTHESPLSLLESPFNTPAYFTNTTAIENYTADVKDTEGSDILDLIGDNVIYLNKTLNNHIVWTVNNFDNIITSVWMTLDFDVFVMEKNATIEVSSFCINSANRGLVFNHSIFFIDQNDANNKWFHLSSSFPGNFWGFCDGSYNEPLRIKITESDVLIDNIILWEKPTTCPWKCNRDSFRNFSTCIECSYNDFDCGIGQERISCTDTGYSQFDSTFCESITGQPLFNDPENNIEGLCKNEPTSDIEEFQNLCKPCNNAPNNSEYYISNFCVWQCKQGYKLNTSDTSCFECNVETCEKGKYLTSCETDSQSFCDECTIIDRLISSEDERKYYDYIIGERCQYKCVNNSYRYDGQCFPCSLEKECDENNQRISVCTSDSDIQCVDCEPPTLGKELASGSSVVGDPCIYECLNGYFRCLSCNDVTPVYANVLNETTTKISTFFEDSTDFEITTTLSENTNMIVQNLRVDCGEFNENQYCTFKVKYQYATNDFQKIIFKTTVDNIIEPIQRIRFFLSVQVSNNDVDILLQSKDTVFKENEILKSGAQYDFEYITDFTNSEEYEISNNVFTMQLSNIITFTIFEYSIEILDYSPSGCCKDDDICLECDDTANPGNSTPLARLGLDDNGTCLWSCNTDFIRVDDYCKYCPEKPCEIGFYQSDCPGCSPCTLPTNIAGELNYTDFTSPGNVLFDATSCGYQCKENFYQSLPGFVYKCTPCNTVQETQCLSQQYIQNCSRFENTKCVDCTKQCDDDSFILKQCGAFEDTVCEKCTNIIPPGATWKGNSTCDWECILPGLAREAYVYNNITEECQRCEPSCDIGYYSTFCTFENQYTGCLPCAKPNGSTFISSGRLTNNSCIWVCPDTTTLTGHTANNLGVCLLNPLSEPLLPPCELECLPGQYVEVDKCNCKSCDPKPNGTLSVWLDTTLTVSPCKWTCVYPYVVDPLNQICVSFLDALFRRDMLSDENKKNITNGNAEQNSFSEYSLVSAPFVIIALILICVIIFKRLRKKMKRSKKINK